VGFSFNKAEAKRWGKAFDRYLRGWLPSEKDSAIIDVGCGRGRLLYFFKERKYINIQGVDISPEQVQLAKEICDNVVKGDAIEHLANHPQSFDFIIGLDIIEHFKKDEVFRFLEVCYKALRHGGRLVLQTPNAESPFVGKVRYGDITHELAFDPQSLKKILLLSGFNKIEYRQTGPVVYGLLSLARFLLWKIIWTCLALWNLAETGSIGSGIYTRVFLISAVKE
jgi:2-polyprenyl-3-methyl-5-hydroxy-6-metoxy-1,4-benzoquinol methylase